MWMAYVQEVEITDLRSGVRHLLQLFENLEFDADHEAVYGMGRFLSNEECIALAEKYNNGATICKQFLEGTACESCLVNQLIELELSDFLCRIEDYLSPDQLQKLSTIEEQEEDANSNENNLENSVNTK